MSASNASTLVASVILGLILFAESLSRGQGQLLPAILGLTLAISGVLLLSTPDVAKRQPLPG
jgi:hypothetical protein